MRALSSQVPKKTGFLETIFGFSEIDIFKMSIFKNPPDFLKNIYYLFSTPFFRIKIRDELS
jgi:hypothetical protein